MAEGAADAIESAWVGTVAKVGECATPGNFRLPQHRVH